MRPGDSGARLTICTGGHPLPVLVTADGSARFVGTPGTILGIFEEVELTDVVVDIQAGDALVLYTDGVTDEQRHGEEFGEDRLIEVLSSSADCRALEIVARLERKMFEFQPAHPQDDTAILVVRASL